MTKHNFGAQLLTLPAIFAGNLFTIPDYQRGYAWEEKQVGELLKDIDHLTGDRDALRHYTGTLVLSRPKDSEDGALHVVDGQQRLTTLVILLSLLCARLPKEQRSEFSARYLERGRLGNERPVLCLNGDTRVFFEKVILTDGNTDRCPITLEAHQRLLDARVLIGKWLDGKLAAGDDLTRVKAVVETKLGFLVYAPEEDAETGIMFEVINNRGKPLSELEKVKNYLIYCCVKLSAGRLRKSIDHDWSEILKNLNVAHKTNAQEEGAFLRYCFAVHFEVNKTDSQYGYEQLKKRIKLDECLIDDAKKERAVQRIAGFVEFMKTASYWYARLYGPSTSGLDPEIVDVLKKIRAQGRHASIMPLFLALVIKQRGKGPRLLKLLQLLELLNFRVYMTVGMTARNDTGQGELYQAAALYYHDKLLATFPDEERTLGRARIETEEDALEFCLVRFVYWYASDERFRKSFVLDPESPFDFYHWRGLRYFLMNYEQKLQPHKTIQLDKLLVSAKDAKTADYPSIEHLWATNNRAGAGENNRKQDKFERRRLGNFVLLELRLNIQGCADDLEDKLTRYEKGFEDEPPTDHQHVRMMAKDAKAILKNMEGRQRRVNFYLDLHKQLNDEQEKRYIAFAESRWSLKDYLGYKQVRKEALEDVVPEEA